jgi:hypothetical protein
VHNCDEPSDSKDKWEKIGFKLEGEWEGDGTRQTHLHGSSPHGYSLCVIEAYTLANQDMEVLNYEEKSESTMSNLDDMWYMEDKESYIQDLDDKDWDDNEDFKEQINANVVDGLHIPHDEIEGMQKGNKEITLLVEIDLLSMPQNKPKIALVKEALRQRYTLKSQDIIDIDDDIVKYSCWANSMSNSLNSMPCSNNDHVDRLDYLENHNETMFMLEQINFMPKEPLLNQELSALHETYASFHYTLICCYNLLVVLIMDAYVYNKFCKSQLCSVLGPANDLKVAYVGRRPDFH